MWNSCTVLSQRNVVSVTSFNYLSAVTNITILNAGIYYLYYGLILTATLRPFRACRFAKKRGTVWELMHECFRKHSRTSKPEPLN